MKVFFVVSILCHLFVTKSMASSAYGWFKNKGTEGDDTLGLGVNNTDGPNNQYSVSGSRRTIVDPERSFCYRKFFVEGESPTGLRPVPTDYIKYICQKFEAFDDDDKSTYYATMFDQHTGIAVYAAYLVKHDEGPLMGSFPRVSKWLQDPDISNTRQGSDQLYAHNNLHIPRGHLVPASTYSFNCIAMVSTFRYTNAVPQFAAFNTGQWSQYEDRVRKLVDVCRLNSGDLYLLTGTSEAKLKSGGPPHAQKKRLKYFPDDNPDNKKNIAIPNSMWTAGCCINQKGQAVGGFGLIGNNDKDHPVVEQKSVAKLQEILAIGIGGEITIELFPGNDRCSVESNQFYYDKLAMHGGGWTKSKKL